MPAGQGRFSEIEVKADRKWNQGLDVCEYALDGGRQASSGSQPTTVEEERQCGRFCYFCATLDPPIRVQHRLVDCPKRRKANAREYRPETMAKARAALDEMRVDCEAKMSQHRAATEAVREQKQALLELAGAIKVLSQQEASRPPPPPPPPPPLGERQRLCRVLNRRRTHQKTMVMKMIARGSKVESTFKHCPTAWGELKAVALMLPHPRVMQGPITPHILYQVASNSLNVDITPIGDDHHLLPFVIALARAPLPVHWRIVPREAVTKLDRQDHPKWYLPPPSDEFVYPKEDAGSPRKSRSRLGLGMTPSASNIAPSPAPSGVGSDGGAGFNIFSREDSVADGVDGVPAKPNTPAGQGSPSWVHGPLLDVYEHELTRERRHGHPGCPLILPVISGMQERARRSLKPSPTDGWVQFAEPSGELYFYNFRRKLRTPEFPPLSRSEVPPCVLPDRQLEDSAKLLVAAGAELTPAGLGYRDAVDWVRTHLWLPRRPVRAMHLAHDPCPIDEILVSAQYLGLAPADHWEFMFLVDAMLEPELPAGWLVHSERGEEYYWNSVLGVAQWEHPQVSLLTGVAKHLKTLCKQEKNAATAAAHMSDAQEGNARTKGGVWLGGGKGKAKAPLTVP